MWLLNEVAECGGAGTEPPILILLLLLLLEAGHLVSHAYLPLCVIV
jgi:hypothetical protein